MPNTGSRPTCTHALSSNKRPWLSNSMIVGPESALVTAVETGWPNSNSPPLSVGLLPRPEHPPSSQKWQKSQQAKCLNVGINALSLAGGTRLRGIRDLDPEYISGTASKHPSESPSVNASPEIKVYAVGIDCSIWTA